MDNKVWERKRLFTTFVYVFEYFIAATELSISYSTSWIYLNEVTKDSQNLNFYYSAVHIAKFLPSVIFINIVTHYSDKYRRVKLFMIIANNISLVGCMIYLIPGSPNYLIVGQFFLGFNFVMRPLMIGEMARSYNQEDLCNIMLVFRGVFCFGKAAGPLLVVFFISVNFYMGPIHIRYSNISSVIIFCLIFMTQIAVYYFADDLSKEFDLKKESSKDTANKKHRDESSHQMLLIASDTKQTDLLSYKEDQMKQIINGNVGLERKDQLRYIDE